METNNPAHLLLLSPSCDSAPLGAMNTPANRGLDGTHSRGGGGPVRKDQSPTILAIFEMPQALGWRELHPGATGFGSK